MDKSLKVATPATAETVSVPLSVPPPGLLPMATVTLVVLTLGKIARLIQHLHRDRRRNGLTGGRAARLLSHRQMIRATCCLIDQKLAGRERYARYTNLVNPAKKELA